MGVFASAGKDVESFFSNLVNSRSAIRRITQFDPSSLCVQIGAEVPDYKPADYFPLKRLDLLDRFAQFGLLAAREAVQSSGMAKMAMSARALSPASASRPAPSPLPWGMTATTSPWSASRTQTWRSPSTASGSCAVRLSSCRTAKLSQNWRYRSPVS